MGHPQQHGLTEKVGFSSEIFNAQDDRTQQDPVLWAATNDVGVDAQFAEHVRNCSNEELHKELEHAKEQIKNDNNEHAYSSKKQFITGVLISRGDESASVDDALDVSSRGNVADRTTDDDVKEGVRELFESIDEYVAGQTATTVSEIEYGDTAKDAVGRYVSLTGEIHLDTENIRDHNGDLDSVLRHEMMHAIHKDVYGVQDNSWTNFSQAVQTGNKRPSRAELKHPNKLEFSLDHSEDVINDPFSSYRTRKTSAEATHIQERVGEIGDKLAASRAWKDVEGMDDCVRVYQLADAQELLTTGFEEYTDKFVDFYKQQPELADFFDDYVTGASWEETTLEDLEGKGVEEQMPGIGKYPVSRKPNRSGKIGGDAGEIIRIKTTPDSTGSSCETANENEHVGYLAEVDTDEGTVSLRSGGFVTGKFEIEEIEEIEQRDWDSGLDLDKMEDRNQNPVN